MRSTRCTLLVVLVLASSLAQHRSVGAGSPQYLFGPTVKLDEPTNSQANDLWNMLTPDGLEMYLSSNRDGQQDDILVAARSTTLEPLGIPTSLAIVNTQWSDTAPNISANGLELYFQSSRPAPEYQKPEIMNKLWIATRSSPNEDFGEPRYLDELNSIFAGETAGPSLSRDGLSLYYSGDDSPGGSADIFVSSRPTLSDPWGPAEGVGARINTNGWEFAPSISADGLSLFFVTGSCCSSRRDIRGEYDMYVSTRSSTSDQWGEAVNLGDTLNTPLGEEWAYLDADRMTIYFTRGLGDAGGADLWQSPLLPFQSVAQNGSGGAYATDFDSLGATASATGNALPTGWTFTANDIVFNDATTRSFPTTARGYVGVYNAGADGHDDRALVTDVTSAEEGELDFRTLVVDSDLHALRLGFDIEAWQLRSGLGVNLGAAAFHVTLEADTGNGFQQVADLGEFSTGTTLTRPAAGNLVDGNDPTYRRSFDTGPIDVDVPVGATLRTRWIGTDASRNVVFGLDNVSLRFAAPGDANIDGVFNSTDLIEVLANGEYEDNIAGNSSWSEGDWTNDNEFDSGDLVRALAFGGYEAAPRPAAVPEPTGSVLVLISAIVLARRPPKRP